MDVRSKTIGRRSSRLSHRACNQRREGIVRHVSKVVQLRKSGSRRVERIRVDRSRSRDPLVLGLLALPVATIALPALDSAASANGVAFQPGDILASVGNGEVDNYSPTGALNDTLNDGTNATFTTGGCFNEPGDFFVTNFNSNSLSEFGPDGSLLNSTWATEPSLPESCTVNDQNDVFVGGQGAPTIYEFDPSGSLINSFNVQGGSGTGGTDWVNLEADQCTLLYTGQGSEILELQRLHPNPEPRLCDGTASTMLPTPDPAERRCDGCVRIQGDPLQQRRGARADVHHSSRSSAVLNEPRPG